MALPTTGSYQACNIAFQNAAVAFARRLDEEPVLLSVWNGATGDGPGGTSEAVGSWQAQGFPIEAIDIVTLN